MSISNLFSQDQNTPIRKPYNSNFLTNFDNNKPDPTAVLGSPLSIVNKDFTDFDRFASSKTFDYYGYSPLRNNEALYDAKQSAIDWWGNSFARLGYRAGNQLINAFSFSDDFKSIDQILSGTNNVQEQEKKLQELFPTYNSPYTKPGFSGFFSKGAHTKWSQLIDQAGFTVGIMGAAIVQDMLLGLVTNGVGSITAAPLLASRVFKNLASFSKTINDANKVENAVQTMLGIKTLTQGVKGLKTAKDGISFTKSALQTVGGGYIQFRKASGEALIESTETAHSLKTSMVDKFKDKNGRDPNAQELEEIESFAVDAARTTYWATTAILLASNAIQNFNIFNTYKSLRGLNLPDKMASKAAKNVFYDKTKKEFIKRSELSALKKSLLLIKGTSKFLLTDVLSEGGEELSQLIISNSAKDYFSKKYDKESVSALDTLAKNIKNSYSTDEGKDNFAMGVMSGLLFSGIGKTINHVRTDNKSINEQTEQIKNTLNAELAKVFKEDQLSNTATEAAISNIQTANEVEELVAENDKKGALDLKHQNLVQSVISASKTGRFDLFMDALKDHLNLTNDEFKAKYDIDINDSNSKQHTEYINNAVREAQNIKRHWDYINDKYKNNPYENKVKSSKDEVERLEAVMQYNAYEYAKELTVLHMSKLDNIAGRIRDIENELQIKYPNLDVQHVYDLIKFDARQDRKRTLEVENKLLEELGDKDSKKTLAKNLKELEYLKKYEENLEDIDVLKELTGNPKNTKKIDVLLKTAVSKYLKNYRIDKKNNLSLLSFEIQEGYDIFKDVLELEQDVNDAVVSLNMLEQPLDGVNMHNNVELRYAMEMMQQRAKDVKQTIDEDEDKEEVIEETPKEEEQVEETTETKESEEIKKEVENDISKEHPEEINENKNSLKNSWVKQSEISKELNDKIEAESKVIYEEFRKQVQVLQIFMMHEGSLFNLYVKESDRAEALPKYNKLFEYVLKNIIPNVENIEVNVERNLVRYKVGEQIFEYYDLNLNYNDIGGIALQTINPPTILAAQSFSNFLAKSLNKVIHETSVITKFGTKRQTTAPINLKELIAIEDKIEANKKEETKGQETEPKNLESVIEDISEKMQKSPNALYNVEYINKNGETTNRNTIFLQIDDKGVISVYDSLKREIINLDSSRMTILSVVHENIYNLPEDELTTLLLEMGIVVEDELNQSLDLITDLNSVKEFAEDLDDFNDSSKAPNILRTTADEAKPTNFNSQKDNIVIQRQITVKNKLRELREQGVLPEDKGIFLTLTVDDGNDYPQEDSYAQRINKGELKAETPVVGVLADKKGNPLFFNNEGELIDLPNTKENVKNFSIKFQILSLSSANFKKRKEEFLKRLKMEYPSKSDVELTEIIENEYKELNSIKDGLRKAYKEKGKKLKKVTTITRVSSGIYNKNLILKPTNLLQDSIEDVFIQLFGETKEKGVVYAKLNNTIAPLFLNKIDSNHKAVILYLLNPTSTVFPNELKSLSSRVNYIKSILYTKKDDKFVLSQNTSNDTISIFKNGKPISFADFSEWLMASDYNINVDKNLLIHQINNPFQTYTIKDNLLVQDKLFDSYKSFVIENSNVLIKDTENENENSLNIYLSFSTKTKEQITKPETTTTSNILENALKQKPVDEVVEEIVEDNGSVLNIVKNKLLKAKNFIKLSKDESHYINTSKDVKTKTYKRVTNFTGKTFKKTAATSSASSIGNRVDLLFRDVFSGYKINTKNVDNYELGDKKLVLEFAKELLKLKTLLESRGETIFAKDIVLHNDELEIAGTVDLLTVDEEGKIRIYDLKTMKSQNILDSYEEPLYDNISLKESHSNQLSLYNMLLYKTYGILAEQLTVIPVIAKHETGDLYPNSISIKEFINLEMQHNVGPFSTGIKQEVIIEDKVEDKKEIKKSKPPIILPTPKGKSRDIELPKAKDTNETKPPISEEEINFIKMLFGEGLQEERIQILKDVIDSKKWGVFTRAGIKLFGDAVEGVGYHEAWHEFSQIYLTKDEKTQLYNYVRKNLKDGSKLTFKQLEEVLADGFMNYMLTGKPFLEPGKKTILQKIFEAIKAFLNNIFGKDSLLTPEYLFKSLSQYDLGGREFSYDNIMFEELAKLKSEFQNLSLTYRNPIKAKNMILEAMDVFMVSFAKQNNIPLIKLFFDKNVKREAYSATREMFKYMSEQEDEYTWQERELYSYVSDPFNFQDFINEHGVKGTMTISGSKLISYNVDASGNISEVITDNDDSVITSDGSFGRASEWDRSGNEEDSKDAASKFSKLLAKTIIKTDIKDGEYTQIINELGLPSLHDYTFIWNLLANKLNGSSGPKEMLSRLEKLENEYPFISQILDFLPKDYDSLENIQLLNIFWQDLNRSLIPIHINLFETDPLEKTPKLKLIRASSNAKSILKDKIKNNFIINLQDSRFIKRDPVTFKVVMDIEGLYNTYFDNKRFLYANMLIRQGEELKFEPLKELRKELLLNLGFIFSEGSLNSDEFKKVLEDNSLFNAIAQTLKNLITNDVTNLDNPLEQLINPYIKLVEVETNKKRKVEKVKITDGLSKQFDKLFDIELTHAGAYYSGSSINADGKTVYELSLNNYTTLLTNALNNSELYPTYFDLISDESWSHLDINLNPKLKSSIYLNSLFYLDVDYTHPMYGKRRINPYKKDSFITLDLINYNGITISDPLSYGANLGHKTVGLHSLDKLLTDLTSLLQNGFSESMRPADKSTAYAIKPTYLYPHNNQNVSKNTVIPVTNLALVASENISKEIAADYIGYPIFKNYLLSELSSSIRTHFNLYDNVSIGGDVKSYKKQKSSLYLFEAIVPTVNQIYKEVVEKYQNEEGYSEELEQKIINEVFKIVDENIIKKELGTYFLNLTNDFISTLETTYLLQPEQIQTLLNNFYYKDNQGKKQLNFKDTILAYVVNQTISYIEQESLIYGSLSDFKDPFKRLPVFYSTGLLANTDEEMIEFFRNKDENYRLEARKENVDIIPHTNKARVSVLQDVKETSEQYFNELTSIFNKNNFNTKDINNYKKEFDEADAQGLSTLDFYRIIKIRMGLWDPPHETAYVKLINNIPLEENEMYYFMPIKLGYGGPIMNKKGVGMAYHKFSIVPILPNTVGESYNIETIRKKMLKENVDYITFASASKGITLTGENGELQPLYTNVKNRTLNEEPFIITELHYKFFKEQLQINPEQKREKIFGSQFRKLLFSDKFLNGIPVDFRMDITNKSIRNKEWDTLSEEEKLNSSSIYKLYTNYTNAIKNISNIKKANLLKRLKINETFNEATNSYDYEITDPKVFSDRLELEAQRRNLPNSLLAHFKIDEKTNTFIHSLEDSKSKHLLQTVLLSMVNNELVRQKINGEALVQMASTGFETPTVLQDDVEVRKSKKLAVNYSLEYGEGDNLTRIREMEIMVSFSDHYKPLLELSYNGSKINTVERLNEILETDKEFFNNHKKLLTLVGYRIPTQGLNSIENMVIVKFLPQQTGNVIVLPSEIVVKAGSDFDIDKLNVIRYNFSTKYKDNIIFNNDDLKALTKNTISKMKELGFDLEFYPDKDYNDIYGVNTILQEVMASGNPESLDEKSLVIWDVLEPLLKDIRENAERIIKLPNEESNVKTHYNRIIDVANEILSSPQSIRELANPNSTSIVKDELADVIKDKLSKVEKFRTDKKGSDKINPLVVLEKFNAFLQGKNTLGIAAKANTMSRLLQFTGGHLSNFYIKDIESDTILETLIYFKVNKMNKEISLPDGSKKEHSFIDLSDIMDVSGKYYKSDLFSQYINAYVDIAKEPFIFYMGATEGVAPILFYLAHMGVEPKVAAHFVNQPAIKSFIKKINMYNSEFYKAANKDVFYEEGNLISYTTYYNKILIGMLEELGVKLDTKKYLNKKNKISSTKLDTYLQTLLKDQMRMPKTNLTFDNLKSLDSENVNLQVASLLQFVELKNQASAFRQIDSILSFDTTPSKGINDASITNMEFEKLLTKDSLIPKEVILKIADTTPISSFRVQSFIEKLYKPLAPLLTSDIVKSVLKNLLENGVSVDGYNKTVKRGKDSKANMIRYFENEIVSFLLQNKRFTDLQTNKETTYWLKYGSLITYFTSNEDNKKTTNKNSIYHKLISLKEKYPELFNTSKNQSRFRILNNLSIQPINHLNKITDKDPYIYMTKWSGEQLTTDLINELEKEWSMGINLLEEYEVQLQNIQDDGIRNTTYNKIKDVQDFYNDLVFVSLLTYGINRSPGSLTDFIPDEKYKEIISPLMREITEQFRNRSGYLFETFILGYDKQFIKNNPKFVNYGKRLSGAGAFKFYADIKNQTQMDIEMERSHNSDEELEIAEDLLLMEEESYIQEPKETKEDIGTNSSTVNITNEPLTKELVAKNPNEGYLFSENLQAYLAVRNLLKEVPSLPRQDKPIKVGVTDNKNQAGIRTQGLGNVLFGTFDESVVKNNNAFAIITKKYQQGEESASFVKEEGLFEDTEEDFKLFREFNEEAIDEALESGLNLNITNNPIAVEKSGLPYRFAQYLQELLRSRLNIDSKIVKSKVKGYGLSNFKPRKENVQLGLFDNTPLLDDESLVKDKKRTAKAKSQTTSGDLTEITEKVNILNLGSFYKKGESSPADIQMRLLADGFIGEIVKYNSSSMESMIEISNKKLKGVEEFSKKDFMPIIAENGNVAAFDNINNDASIIMLARNSELFGKALKAKTIDAINKAHLEGKKFVVGNSYIDRVYIDHLISIGAKFTVFELNTQTKGKYARVYKKEIEDKIKSSYNVEKLKNLFNTQIKKMDTSLDKECE